MKYPIPTGSTGDTVYALQFDGAGNVWNGSAFVPVVQGSLSSYAIACPETGTTGLYGYTVPAVGTTAGVFPWVAYKRAGGSPAWTDTPLAAGEYVREPDPWSTPVPGSYGAGTAGEVLGALGSISDGVAQGGGARTLILAASDNTAAGLYNRRVITLVAGTGAGQSRIITAYTGAAGTPARTATVDRDWVVVPDSTSQYVLGVCADAYNLRGPDGVALSPAGLDSVAIDGGNARQAIQAVAAVLAGETVVDGNAGTIAFKGLGASTQRVFAVTDGAGVRSSVNLSLTP